MFFQRILILVALLGTLGGCVPESNPPQTAAAPAGAATVRSPPLPPAVEKQVGPVMQSPALQDLVDRVGQRLVRRAGIPGHYNFHVLDQPEPNAHALGANYSGATLSKAATATTRLACFADTSRLR